MKNYRVGIFSNVIVEAEDIEGALETVAEAIKESQNTNFGDISDEIVANATLDEDGVTEMAQDD
jgi:hypothetical protein